MAPEVLPIGECDLGDVIRFQEWGPSHKITGTSQRGQRIELEEVRPNAGRLQSTWYGDLVIRGLDN